MIHTSYRNMYSAALLALAIAGCSAGTTKKPEVYSVAYRQSAPEPVYSRTMYGLEPYTVPSRDTDSNRTVALIPMTHFEAKNESLESMAKMLGKSMRYRSYCSGVIADRKGSINTIGTIDEIGATIAKTFGINVIVDHDMREVRFLTGREAPAPSPRL